MFKTTITENIFLEPKELNCDYKENIINKIKNKYTNYCSEENGHILKIYENIEIKGNFLSSVNSGVYFIVKFKVKSLKPKIDDEIIGEVFFIHSNGIILKINEKLKIAISKNNLGKYVYKDDTFKRKNDSINLGDKIKSRISSIKYEKGSFHLLGVFCEKIK